MDYLYRVEVAPGLGYECIAEEGLALTPGDVVIVQCERYQDYATVVACHDDGPVPPEKLDELARESNKGRHVEGHRVPKVIRRANEADKQTAVENDMTAQSMAERANERIAAHRLDMKLVHTHYSFDRRMVLFQFAAEGRVDFRELLRDLSHTLRTRVELRQVGVRDEAALQGGIGVCGRPFCCATFLKRFSSISVKMAKIQGLSLNPANISGTCGRLKCCLQYEYSCYREELAEAKRRRAEGPREQERPADDGSEPQAPTDAPRQAPAAEGGRRPRGSERRRPERRPESQPRQATASPDAEESPETRPSRPEPQGPGTPGDAAQDAGAPGDGAQDARSGSRRRRGRRRGRRGGNRQGGGEGNAQGGGAPQNAGGTD